MRLPRRDWPRYLATRLRGPAGVVGLLVVAQWIAIAVFVAVVRHNGWLFYQGGDQTFFYTSAWSFVHGHVPESEVGYGWSYVLAPLAGIFGPNVLRALPAVVLLQVVVLQPVALACVYGIAARIGGRRLGYLAAALWVAGPFLVIPLWDYRYHGKYVEQFLPQALGLSGLGDFASAVALLVAAYLTVRALDSAGAADIALAGLAAGFAIGIKPANALFLPAPVLALLVARRFRELVPFGLALAPALVALSLWKLKGLGSLPLFHGESRAVALGAGAPPVASVGHYLHLNWAQLHDNYLSLREYFWSVRLLQWLPIAGFVGVARRTPALAVLLGAWLAAFVILKGSSTAASVQEGTFLRLFIPALPAFALLATAIPLLWPGLRRLAALPLRRPLVAGWRSPAFLASALVFALVPLALVAALPPLRSASAAKISLANTFVPVASFGLRADPAPNGGVRLSWRSQAPGTAHAFYTVFRDRSAFAMAKGSPPFPIVHQGLLCETSAHTADHCSIEMQPVGTARSPTFTEAPPRGDWTYRIAVTANWLDDRQLGDPLVISEPVAVTVR